ncbi:MAG: DUF4153 domain-containing protein [Actinomycetales bacterium]
MSPDPDAREASPGTSATWLAPAASVTSAPAVTADAVARPTTPTPTPTPPTTPGQRIPPVRLPGVALVGAAVLGVVVATTVVAAPLGVQYPVAAAVLAAVALVAVRGRSMPRVSVVLGVVALGLAAVPAVSDSTPLVVLCLVAAAGSGILAVTRARSWARGLLAPALMVASAVLVVPWLARRLSRTGGQRSLPPGVIRGALLAGAVLLVVGWLLVGADAAFAALVTPEVDLGWLPARVAAGVAAAWVALAVALTVAAPVAEAPGTPRRGRGPVAEWALPLAAAIVLLGVFVVVQLVELARPGALLDGGATPAARARQGFGQLVAVTVLLVALLVWAGHRCGSASRPGRVAFAALGGTLVLLVGAVSVIALGRMGQYQEVFGWTVLRILVAAFEAWLALVLVTVSLLWLTRRLDLVPPVTAVAAAAGMLALGLARPEALAAAANVARFEETGRIDTAYLATLSADAVPAVSRLPRAQRCEVFLDMAGSGVGRDLDLTPDDLLGADDPWYAVNASRASARSVLVDETC